MLRFTGRPSARAVSASLTVAALLLSAACGNEDEPAGDTPAATAALPDKKATGEPIVIGLINNDTNPLGSFADITKAAKVAVTYVNDNLGGVGGRPFQLEVCASNGSAAASANCAAELIAKKPAVVVGGLDLGADGSVPALGKAGIGYLAGSPISAVEYTSPNAFSLLAGASGSVSAGAAYVARELKPKRVAIMFNDNPQARLAAEGFVEKVLKANGVTDTVLVPYGNNETDLTGPVSQALEDGTDAVIGVMQGSGCAAVIKAKQSLGSTAKFMFPGSCADPQVIKAAGPGAEGTYYSVQMLLPGTADPDVQAFEAAMAQYGPEIPLSGFTQGVFGTIVTLSEVMAGVSAPEQPSAVIDAFKKVAGLQTFTGPEATCDGKQQQGLISFCTRSARIGQVKDGKLVDVGGQWYAA